MVPYSLISLYNVFYLLAASWAVPESLTLARELLKQL